MFEEMYKDIVRSSLYYLEPIGVGTQNVESLSGYLSRLAVQHLISTGDFIAKIIAPLLKKRYLTNQAVKGGEGLYKSSNGLNGLGTLAQDFILILQELTLRKDLKVTTLLSWAHVFPTRGLLRNQRAWCPFCYMDDYASQENIYERLIWNIQLVNFCTRHNQYLSVKCPYCNKTNPILTRKSRPGYCSVCEEWLGQTQKEANPSSINEKYTFATMIGEMLSQNPIYEGERSRYLVSNAINFYINEWFNGNNHKMANELNIPLSTLNTWCSGDSLPQIKSLIEICEFLGLSVSDFLRKKGANLQLQQMSNTSIKEKDKLERKKHDHQQIRKYLQYVIKNELPLSIKKVAETIGCDRKLLSRKYPIECNKIKDNFDKHLEVAKRKRDTEKLKIVENAFYLLITKNEYPSRRKMENIIGEGLLREKLLKEKWKSLKENWILNLS